MNDNFLVHTNTHSLTSTYMRTSIFAMLYLFIFLPIFVFHFYLRFNKMLNACLKSQNSYQTDMAMHLARMLGKVYMRQHWVASCLKALLSCTELSSAIAFEVFFKWRNIDFNCCWIVLKLKLYLMMHWDSCRLKCIEVFIICRLLAESPHHSRR